MRPVTLKFYMGPGIAAASQAAGEEDRLRNLGVPSARSNMGPLNCLLNRQIACRNPTFANSRQVKMALSLSPTGTTLRTAMRNRPDETLKLVSATWGIMAFFPYDIVSGGFERWHR